MKHHYIALLLFLFAGSQGQAAEWKDDTEAGIVITNGNSQTQSYNLKDSTKFSADKNSLEFSASYINAKSSGAISALNWLLGLRYERQLSALWSSFLGQSVEGDRFAGVMQRYNSDLGAKYFFAKREKDLNWFAEAGYRFTHEHDSNGAIKNLQKARLYSEAEKFWSPNVSTKLWVEYVPNFTISQNWLFNTELSLSAAINAVFSVKTAYLLRYNHQPAASASLKSDSTFTTSLVAKF